jgi:hypothetical protein
LFKQDLEYVAYVKDALEFFEVDRIFVSENNVQSPSKINCKITLEAQDVILGPKSGRKYFLYLNSGV